MASDMWEIYGKYGDLCEIFGTYMGNGIADLIVIYGKYMGTICSHQQNGGIYVR